MLEISLKEAAGRELYSNQHGQTEDDDLATIDIATKQSFSMAPYICREYLRACIPDTKYLPQFIGTSLALAIPLFMLRRQRISFNNLKTPPPPKEI